jgi:hypothetical protein
VAEYRIYMLNGIGRFAVGADARCADDQEAYDLARGMLSNGAQAEVWCGARRLGVVSSALFGETEGTFLERGTPGGAAEASRPAQTEG